ncbi:hypothetical protein HK096_005520 [Nowakowskiella sp. JEL0078]|nr:hypothetical protein HK096_005520 [Nowakowskiella sp. JEL0078]
MSPPSSLPDQHRKTLLDLVSKVGRAFYEPVQIIILDVLSTVNSIKEDELSSKLRISPKELNRACGVLREQGLIKTEGQRNEPGEKDKETQKKERSQKNNYYVDYKQFVDSVKLKIYKITSLLRDEQSDEGNSFFCPVCETRYSTLDISRLVTPEGNIICENELCNGAALDHEEILDVQTDSNERHTKITPRFLKETKPLSDLLKLTDQIKIPEYDPKAGINDETSSLSGAALQVSQEKGASAQVIVKLSENFISKMKLLSNSVVNTETMQDTRNSHKFDVSMSLMFHTTENEEEDDEEEFFEITKTVRL